MFQKLINKLDKAHKEGKINKEIEIAEKLGYFLLAGTIAKEHGLLKIAYDNFKKAKDIENINRIQEIIFQKKPLNIIKIQRHEELNERPSGIYKEKLDYGNWSKPFYRKIDNHLIDCFKKIQEPEYSYKKIKILN